MNKLRLYTKLLYVDYTYMIKKHRINVTSIKQSINILFFSTSISNIVNKRFITKNNLLVNYIPDRGEFFSKQYLVFNNLLAL